MHAPVRNFLHAHAISNYEFVICWHKILKMFNTRNTTIRKLHTVSLVYATCMINITYLTASSIAALNVISTHDDKPNSTHFRATYSSSSDSFLPILSTDSFCRSSTPTAKISCSFCKSILINLFLRYIIHVPAIALFDFPVLHQVRDIGRAHLAIQKIACPITCFFDCEKLLCLLHNYF